MLDPDERELLVRVLEKRRDRLINKLKYEEATKVRDILEKLTPLLETVEEKAPARKTTTQVVTFTARAKMYSSVRLLVDVGLRPEERMRAIREVQDLLGADDYERDEETELENRDLVCETEELLTADHPPCNFHIAKVCQKGGDVGRGKRRYKVRVVNLHEA
jgi:hypothetical protein